MPTQLPLPDFTISARPVTPRTWTQAIATYLRERREASTASAASVKDFRRDLEFLARLFPGRDPASLTTKEALWAVQRASAKGAAATAARRHGTWRAFYRWVYEKGWITGTPFLFGFAQTTPRPSRPVKYLSPGQAEALLAAAQDDPAAVFLIRLVLGTGMKRAEIARLVGRDLDERENIVTVRGRRDRSVPVQADLFTAYRTFVEEKLAARPGAGERAVPFTTRWMEMCLSKAAREVEAEVGFRPTFQTLRWTRAVWDLRNGVPEERVRVKLGYSKMSWQLHARPALLPWIPGVNEGQTPGSAPKAS